MPAVTRQDAGDFAVLTLNRPEVLNAVSNHLLDEFEAHLDDIESGTPRALIITGQGRAFCAGSDLNERDGDPALRIAQVHRLIERMTCFPKISIAALNGPALGGGLEIALACTFRVAVSDARLGLPEIKLGLMPVYGGTQLLPRLIGERRALQMMLSGEAVAGAKALEFGLVDQLVERASDLLDAALHMAKDHALYGLIAQRAIRRAVREGLQLPLTDALTLERTLGRRVAATADAREGIQAFLEKRTPVFRDV
jgi:enoyl-CoA hydratase/carnithine racemase